MDNIMIGKERLSEDIFKISVVDSRAKGKLSRTIIKIYIYKK